jgi:hypothetical protein
MIGRTNIKQFEKADCAVWRSEGARQTKVAGGNVIEGRARINSPGTEAPSASTLKMCNE